MYLKLLTKIVNSSKIDNLANELNYLKEIKNQYGDYFLTKDVLTYFKFISKLAKAFDYLNENKEANSLFLEALNLAEENKITLANKYYQLLHDYALFSMKIGKYEKAKKLFAELVTIYKHLNKQKGEEYISLINNLANLYILMGEHSKTYLLHEEINAYYNGSYIIPQEKNISFLKSKAKLAQIEGKYLRAEDNLKKAISLEKTNTSQIKFSSGNIYSTINNLKNQYLNLLIEEGKYKEAFALYEELARYFEKSVAKNSFEYIDFLENMSSLIKIQGNYEKSAATLFSKYLANSS